jgi:hypothetical protein
MSENYQKALEDARAEMAYWSEQVAAANKRLPQLRATVEALTALMANLPKNDALSDLGDIGISDAIRQVLKDAGMGLTPTEVKAKLGESGVNLAKYANPGAVIHNTLKRLESQGEIVPVVTASGMAYTLRPVPPGNLSAMFELLSKSGKTWTQRELTALPFEKEESK